MFSGDTSPQRITDQAGVHCLEDENGGIAAVCFQMGTMCFCVNCELQSLFCWRCGFASEVFFRSSVYFSILGCGVRASWIGFGAEAHAVVEAVHKRLERKVSDLLWEELQKSCHRHHFDIFSRVENEFYFSWANEHKAARHHYLKQMEKAWSVWTPVGIQSDLEVLFCCSFSCRSRFSLFLSLRKALIWELLQMFWHLCAWGHSCILLSPFRKKTGRDLLALASQLFPNRHVPLISVRE